MSFSNSRALATAVSFSAPGLYTLLFSATDGTHGVAYDAVVVAVTVGVSVAREGCDMIVSSQSALAQRYRVEQSVELGPGLWTLLSDQLPGMAEQSP
ncbi:MAG: hypothetical protein H0U88_02625 [Chthoniobacterales bacterium]|nr:hypothetical protein [Chthoniobacterales bacterium]